MTISGQGLKLKNFGQVSRPLYVVIDNQERLVNKPIGYTPDALQYLDWLECGKQTFDRTAKIKHL